MMSGRMFLQRIRMKGLWHNSSKSTIKKDIRMFSTSAKVPISKNLSSWNHTNIEQIGLFLRGTQLRLKWLLLFFCQYILIGKISRGIWLKKFIKISVLPGKDQYALDHWIHHWVVVFNPKKIVCLSTDPETYIRHTDSQTPDTSSVCRMLLFSGCSSIPVFESKHQKPKRDVITLYSKYFLSESRVWGI